MTLRVSVIIPSYNMGHFLEGALRSIQRQDPGVHEVLLIDGGSNDETLAIIGRYQALGLPIQVINEPWRGPAAARNVGIFAATGDVISFLDIDDLWPEGKLRRQLARLESLPKVDMVSGYIRYFDTLGESGLEPAIGSRVEDIFHVHLGACLYRRSVLVGLGGLDPSFTYSEDVDLLLRVREQQIPFTILRSPELYYRLHASSMMHQNDPRKLTDFNRAARQSVLRRRASGQLGQALPDFSTFLQPEQSA